MNNMIEVTNLKKAFKQNRADAGLFRTLFGRVPSEIVTALEDVSFSVKQGEFYSLLGRNGAGKTTTIKVLCTLLLADSGTVTVDGFGVDRNSSDARAMLGVSIRGERSVYWRLSGRQNLAYFGRLYDIKGTLLKDRVGEIGEIIGLTDRLDDYVERYSMGHEAAAGDRMCAYPSATSTAPRRTDDRLGRCFGKAVSRFHFTGPS
jgi:ABC-2 type transport system ATP-binding protein